MECVSERVRTVGGEESDWYGVGQSSRQGYVLALWLTKILFNAVLRVTVERFSTNADLVKGMVCTKVKYEKGWEGWGRGGSEERARQKTQPDCVGSRNRSGGILCADDDSRIGSRSRNGLAKMMADIICDVRLVRTDSFGSQDGDHVPDDKTYGEGPFRY